MSKLLLLILPATVVLLVLLVRQFPRLGWLTLGFFVVSAYDYSGYTKIANIGGLTIYPADVAALVLLAAIVFTPGALHGLRPVELWIWVPLLLAIIISLFQGIQEFGLGVAANETRGLVQLIAFTTWVWGRMRLPGFDRSLRRFTILTALALVADAAYHIYVRGIGQVDQLIEVNGQLVTSRPLVAGQALVLGLLGVALVVRERRAVLRLLGLVCLALVVVCQHRSVWVALAVSLAVLVLASPRVRGQVLALGFVCGVGILIAYSSGSLDPLLAKFNLAYHSRGTLDDRLLATRTLVDQQNAKGPSAVLLGQPLGTGFVRRGVSGDIETFAPHDYYVLLYLRVGLVGAACFVLGLLRGLRISLGRRDARAVAWSAGIMTYGLAYNLPIYVGPLLAVALTASLTASAEPDSSATDTAGPARVPTAAA
jgi:hypothetical protein